MTATAEPLATPVEAPSHPPLTRGEGVELLGAVHGCGYRDGAWLVRRGDGQMVQLGPLMYAVLESADGRRTDGELAEAASERLGRRLGEEHIRRLTEKLTAQGLLAGSEHRAPPRRNPLLSLRWKVLITDPALTRRLTAPFAVLFRPWLMWPILAAFGGVFWFVLLHKGVASATAEAFHSPGLLLLVFGLAVLSAGFHELGHAAACRYGGATPGGMGMGLYLVWPAFYTDVTDTYRLPRRARLRVDLAGLYFNAVVAVVTMGAWLVWRADALLLLVALQVLQMIKQLSPVIRADGYHILSDATGVPDLYSQMGPTLRRLLPGHRREPSALSGWARLLVTAWVLIVVPVLISLSLGAVLLLPKLGTSAWDSGRHLAMALPRQTEHGQILDVLASLVRLLALALPVAGSVLVTQKILRTTAKRAQDWSRGQPRRQAAVAILATAAAAGIAWAWWPSGQYQPVHAVRGGTISGLARLISAPTAAARPGASFAQLPAAAPVRLAPGRHLAVAMIPVGGATRRHPALFFIRGTKGHAPVAVLSTSSPDPAAAPTASSAGGRPGPATISGPTTTSPGTTTVSGAPPAAGSASSPTPPTGSMPSTGPGSPSSPTSSTTATAFPFKLPSPPGPHGTQAVAEGTTAGGVAYDVAYAVVTVRNGAPVDETNSAYALADCNGCTTVAVSFQVVLVVGRSRIIAPVNVAGALNDNCPACVTTAIADQIVVTLTSQPSAGLLAELEADLRRLNALPALGAGGTPAAVATAVAAVQQQIQSALNDSGLVSGPAPTAATSASGGVPAAGAAANTSSGSGGTATSGGSAATPAAGNTSSASPAGTGTATAPGTATGAAGQPSSTTAAPATPTTGSTTPTGTASTPSTTTSSPTDSTSSTTTTSTSTTTSTTTGSAQNSGSSTTSPATSTTASP